MDHEFWQERWREDRIAFHEGEPNALLLDHFPHLELSEGSRIFVPLCGKAVDLDWLLQQGLQVVGIELHKGAVEEVFQRLNLTPVITETGGLKRLEGDALTIFVGDFFKLTAEALGPVDAVYDRAALVAMPPKMRIGYAQHLVKITQAKRQLIITYDYDPGKMEGPPFSVPAERIHGYYGQTFEIARLADSPISGPLSARVRGREQVWSLSPRNA